MGKELGMGAMAESGILVLFGLVGLIEADCLKWARQSFFKIKTRQKIKR
jgi:hypothetical protein